MSKTAAEIIEAHKRTIEVFTGKNCTIILTDRSAEQLRRKSLTDILLTAEKFNSASFSIVSEARIGEVIKLRKIFHLIAKKAGYSARQIGRFLNKNDHTLALHHIRTGKNLLQTDLKFKQLYEAVLLEAAKD